MNNITELRMPTVLAALLIPLIAASCNKMDDIDMTEELCIDVMLSDDTRSPIYDNYLPDGSSIGVTIVENGKDTYNGVTYHNVKFTAYGTGSAQKWIPERPVILSEVNAKIYAYYPYTEDYHNHEITLTNDETDNMYGLVFDQTNRDNKTARIYMYHRKFITRIQLKRGTYEGDGNITRIHILPGACWSIAKTHIMQYGSYVNGTQQYSSMKAYDVQMSLDDSPVLETMWLPTLNPIADPFDIYVIMDGLSVYYRTDEKYIWEQGQIYEFTLTINR